ncbi:MAG: hypothetical protein GX575_29445 [Candidatus Anammoximicrobium sp.]|nr:hypothetical protein [Candidatus Anammoximicrobium sp.]
MTCVPEERSPGLDEGEAESRPAIAESGVVASSEGRSKEEIYLELAKIAQQSIESRRAYEWKIAFGLWSGIGLFTYFMVESHFSLAEWQLSGLGVLYAIIWCVWTFTWQPFLHLAFEKDKRWKHYYMHKAEIRDETKSQKDPWEPTAEPSCRAMMRQMKKPWMWVQSLPTAVFLIASFAIIHGTAAPKAPDMKADVLSVSGANLDKVLDKLTK